MDLEELEAAFAERRYRQLAEALGDAGADEDLRVVRLRAQLATRGHAPLVDAVEAAERLREARAPDAPAYLARAIRALAKAGARGAAEATLEEARAAHPGDPELTLAAEQLETDELEAEDRAEHAARLALREGDVAAARECLEAELASRPPAGRERAHRLLADLTRAERDFAAAADCFGRAVADAPEASDASLLAASGALCRWAAGDVEAGLEALRAIREETRGRRADLLAHLRAADVLDRVDRDPERRDGGPRWVFGAPVPLSPRAGDAGAGALAKCLARFGVDAPAEPLDSIGMLRHRLGEAGVRSIRLVGDPAAVEAATRAGGLVVLQEERPTHTAFTLVLGVEPVAGLLLLHEPARGGAYLQTFEEQADRGRLFGGGALVALGLGDEAEAALAALADEGLAHDPRFDAIDRCDVDESGQVPSRARVDAMAERAIEVAPTLPTPHRRQGEAMLEQLRAGRLAGGRLERWVAVTRERFPRAEWAHQIHAQAMECWGRPYEAAIAWADAAAIDPWDHRNPWGEARCLLQVGQTTRAEALLRRALSIQHGHAPAMARWATLLERRGRLDRARRLSELAEALAPGDPDVLGARATVLEAMDRHDEALARLERIADENPRDTGARARILKRLFHDGRWGDARPLAETLLRVDPADPLNWDDVTFVCFASGDGGAAFDTALAGVSRCGADPALVDGVARVLGTLFTPEEMEARAEEMVRALGRSPLSLMNVAVDLVRRRHDALGISVALAARELMPHDANGPWRAAQTLLGVPAERGGARVAALLDETIERAGRYPHPRVVKALYEVEADPEACLALLEEADAAAAPALVWKALEQVHLALGQADDAARVTARLRELDADHVLRAAGFLGTVGMSRRSLELLDGALADADGDAGRRLAEEAARQHLRLDEVTEAAARLASIDAPDVFLDVRVALAAGDWERAARRAEEEVLRVTRRSAGGAYDGWVMRARLAGARLALGEPAWAERVRARAERHADARAELTLIGRAAAHPDARDDERALTAFAPGAMITVERGGLAW